MQSEVKQKATFYNHSQLALQTIVLVLFQYDFCDLSYFLSTFSHHLSYKMCLGSARQCTWQRAETVSKQHQ
jgi:hypothetical protein